MTDTPLGQPAAPAPPPSNRPSPTTIREMAPWVVLVTVAILAVGAKCIGTDASVLQLLATVAGICGGVLKVADGARPSKGSDA
jgi:hypothetical protein